MQQLELHHKDGSYPIYIGKNLLQNRDIFLPLQKSSQVMIVSNTTVAKLYLDTVVTTLKSLNISSQTVILEDGEQYKNLDAVSYIYDALLEYNFNRDSAIIALGGGVVGDIAGFAASSYLRGIDFIQVPTTLLAQVDSSVGGKTGVNHPLGKNMIGAFYQPKMVIIDTSTLITLSQREFSAGMAEVIKYALIFDENFLSDLEMQIDNLMTLDLDLLAKIIKKCCQFKADIVALDEKEQGNRALLNFGHTFGHAIEKHQGFGSYIHGEAVAIGMVQASILSKNLGFLTAYDVERIIKLLQKIKLPIYSPKQMKADDYLALMKLDKKVANNNIRLILLKELGKAYINSDVKTEQIITAITQSESGYE